MTRTIWLVIPVLMLFGCGTDSEDSSMSQSEDSDAEWLEDEEESIDTGSFSVNLPGGQESGMAVCDINLMRGADRRMANVILSVHVIGKGCDGMGNCSNPDMQSGLLKMSGGIEGDNPFATMILGYEPPGDSEEQQLWMYNVLYKSAPFSRFDMKVDGEAFNVLTSDLRDADNFSKGPHIWNTKIEIEADMVQAPAAGDQSSPGLQTRGEFSYEGPCEIFGQIMQL